MKPLIRTLLLIAGLAASADEAVYRRQLDRIPSLDPITAETITASRAVMLCYETLLEYDYAARPYKLIPCLAEALPEISADGLVYTFRIRRDRFFHADPAFGGKPRPLTAQDLVYSFGRLADRKNAAPGSWVMQDVAEVTAPDPFTLRIRLTKPSIQFIWYLAMQYTAAVPKEAVEHYGADFGSVCVGTGPYRLDHWRRNYEIVFRRVPEWPGWKNEKGRPFDTIIYYVMDDVSTQWLSFLDGQLDFLGEISRDNWDAVIRPDGKLDDVLIKRGIKLHSMPTLETMYIGCNMRDPVVGRNKKLRQALNCAFDLPKWIRFYNNRVVPLTTPVPEGIDGRLETPFPYSFDLPRARALLAEAGYPDGIDPATGKRLTLTIDLGRANQDMRESTELLVSFFSEVGIDLQPRYNTWPAFLKKVSAGQTQLFRVGWSGDYPDPQNFLQLFISANVPPGPNRAGYVNPEFDRLYEEAVSSADAKVRTERWHALQRMVQEDCPWIFTHCNRAFSLTSPRVGGYIPHDFPFGMEKHLYVLP